MATRALVVEDNTSIRELVATHLRDAEFAVSEADGLDKALKLTQSNPYDIAILDVSLPDGNGYEVCRSLRAREQYTPVIMLTARDTEADRVLGLELGADDYVTKPFSIVELVARVKAQLRRTRAEGASRVTQLQGIELENLSIDPSTREVHAHDQPVYLTALEFDLLLHLARHPGRVFTRAQLLDSVWGHTYDGYEHTVNSNINRLRAKIEKDASDPEFVKTVWGVGYCFRSD